MTKLLAYPLTVIYFIFFGLTLVVFHPIQWLCLNMFGYQAHKKSVDWLQFFLMRCTNILGTRYSFNNPYKIDANQPIIIVANHQSMYDIPPIIWYMRKHHPKFISKKELGKGIPSVSFNLKYGGSALIDRKKPKEAVQTIKNFAEYIKTNNRAATIFPEGTRSRTGLPKPFQKKGLITLFEGIPNAMVIPITINNSWKMLRYGKLPMGLGAHLKFKVHQPVKVSDFDYNTLIKHLETEITKDVIV
ncbi:lysophospholipid acyltransferase family protein [Mangrovimonas spongiae]|uniref:1-acyl-sn-glycerol-3-phosphate acyltransferase n=1 Tax=Mangrovimonas spongiae TaxID=2494697 RepID=A0A428K4W8_9FLAO|nr:lysophospholipid acyltransferase family protein [Mangrovimonas spongiae]RSK41433.1 1-acyl-sn-glycerol-3-phosphate acyltransferase [Mangrovimonas spongiae]